jgi:hypothetical protein
MRSSKSILQFLSVFLGLFFIFLSPLISFAQMVTPSGNFMIGDDVFSSDSGFLSESSSGDYAITSSIETVAHSFTSGPADIGLFAGYHAMLFDAYVGFTVSPINPEYEISVVSESLTLGDLGQFTTDSPYEDIVISLNVEHIEWLENYNFDGGVFNAAALISKNGQEFILALIEIDENDLEIVNLLPLNSDLYNFISPLNPADDYVIYPVFFNFNFLADIPGYDGSVNFGTLSPNSVFERLFISMGTIENEAGFDVYVSQNAPLTGNNTSAIIPGVTDGSVTVGSSEAGMRTLKTAVPLASTFDNQYTALSTNPQLIYSKRDFSRLDLGVYNYRVAISNSQPQDTYENTIYFTFVARY